MSPKKDKMRRGRMAALIQAVRLPTRPRGCPHVPDLHAASCHAMLLPPARNIPIFVRVLVHAWLCKRLQPPTRACLLLLVQADSEEKVKAILLSSQTEGILLKMNWKVRSTAQRHLRNRAAQFSVDVPANFGAYDVRPRNTPKAMLVPSITEASSPHPAAVAALADLRFS